MSSEPPVLCRSEPEVRRRRRRRRALVSAGRPMPRPMSLSEAPGPRVAKGPSKSTSIRACSPLTVEAGASMIERLPLIWSGVVTL